MGYEEKIINGVLCWRYTSDDEWPVFSLEDMAHKYQERKIAATIYIERVNRALNILQGGG